MNDQAVIRFGPLVLAFISPSKTIIKELRQLFSGYECVLPPDYSILVMPSEQMTVPVTLPEQQWVPLIVKGRNFEIGPGVIAGTFNLSLHEIAITIHDKFFSFPVAEIFQSFLYRLYHTLCEHRAIESCFVHGCGVLKEHITYLFIGPHQAGKTTVGRTSGATVIHDDQILISRIGTGFTMDSPPLPARDNFRCHVQYERFLERIFMIVKDSAFALHPVAAEAAFAALYREVVTPVTLTSNNANAARKKKARFCLEIIKMIPFFELHFDKEGAFWQDLLQRPWEQLHDQQHR
jgi:hypothetical protein